MLSIIIEGYTMNLDRMKALKAHLWEYLGEVGEEDITISTDGEY